MRRMFVNRLAIVAMAVVLCGSATAFAQVPLGTAQNFAVLAGSTVTNTGPTVITSGDVGVSPGSSITGFPPGIVVGGAIHAADGVAAQAQTDLTTAYNTAAALPCGTLVPAELGGTTLTPGVYCVATSAQITGTLTLDFQGNANALFVFKIGSTLTTASASSVALINTGTGTCPSNVFWQVGSSATLGTGTDFAGNILALTSITLTTGASVDGRTLARNGAVTLDSNAVTVCDRVTACGTITLSPATLPNGVLGAPYSQTITASGGTAPYTFAVTSGNLPNGLVLNTATGSITGIPTALGTFPFTIRATDSLSCPGTRTYSVTISAVPATGTGIPTLGFAGMALLTLLIAGAGLFVMSRLSQ
jgi:hypothetical protein